MGTTTKGLVAHADTTIAAPIADVWHALVDPGTIAKYMFGATVESDWIAGSPIRWKGEWKGKPYEDKGVIWRIEPERVLEYSHFSPLTGARDVPESYHTVTIELSTVAGETLVALSQDNNETEEAKGHSEKNWSTMLDGLKKVVEGEPAQPSA